ncbi:MAG: glycosyltransferase [Terrimicrobiaceae bacterium]
MEVHFYLPEKYLPDSARQEAWKEGKITTLEQGGKIACAQCWIYQTWVALQSAGVKVNLTPEIPREGILVGLSGFFGDDFRAPDDVFFAGIVADYLPHPGAHLHILQNPVHARRLRHSAYMPLWPHPNLIPREANRGDVFETIGFFGDAQNLAPELRDPAWIEQLGAMGLRLVIYDANRWHDYSDADCVIAIRGFGLSPYLHKPATKLYNAWLAGVPFIGGMDSAYAADGRAGVNFLQASSPQELLSQIRRLKDDVTLRHKLVAAGYEASRHFNATAILERWKTLLAQDLPDRARKWRQRSPLSRRIFSFSQAAGVWLDRKLRR